jgi:hypothetical protein
LTFIQQFFWLFSLQDQLDGVPVGQVLHLGQRLLPLELFPEEDHCFGKLLDFLALEKFGFFSFGKILDFSNEI